jgi:hypothetical protein
MMALDFSRRNTLSELIDSSETDLETFRACLIDLTTVNQLTLAYRPTLQFFERLVRSGRLPFDRTITIVDVGSGSGDMLRKIDKWAARRRLKVDLVGVDLNPWSASTAEGLNETGRPIRFITTSVFDYWPANPIDIVISSLFTHHLDDFSVIEFIAWMEAKARIGWFVNDLHRRRLPFHFFRLLSRALRFHHFVQHDGPVSIARAFSADDWNGFLNNANATMAEVHRCFPYRLCVTRIKSQCA